VVSKPTLSEALKSLLIRALDSSIKSSGKVKKDIALFKQSLSDNPHNLHNIPNNYLTFKMRINSLDEKERDSMLDYVKDNCELIVVITSDISEGFQLFDSQNARNYCLFM
jgi:hypothetical protein